MQFFIDCNAPVTPFSHYWELCVGSCHAYTALRADWQRMMQKAHEELGFRYVRFHGLLSDDMSVMLEKRRPEGRGEAEYLYSFVNIDKIIDFLLSIGMKPFLELSFMPSCIAREDSACFLYPSNRTPPRDYDLWEELIRRLTAHLVKRYGAEEVRQWYFEVWNEPNLPFFWRGTKEEYFRLYQASAQAVKGVDPQLKVGGPSSSAQAWINDLRSFCQENALPLDFITTHHYPTDDPLWRSGLDMPDYIQKVGFAEAFGRHKYPRGVLREMAAAARRDAGELPLIYTEWNVSAEGCEPLRDEAYAAAAAVKILSDNAGIVDGYSFWTVSDIFEEFRQASGVFHGGFGLQTLDGIEKPVYRAFELMHHLGTERLPVKGGGSAEDTLEVLATKKENGLSLLLHNHQVEREKAQGYDVTLQIVHCPETARAAVQRIDDGHCNPKRAWADDMGSPEYATAERIEALREAARLHTETMPVSFQDGILTLHLNVPAHGVAAVDILFEGD